MTGIPEPSAPVATSPAAPSELEVPAVEVPVRTDVGNWASSVDRLAVDAGRTDLAGKSWGVSGRRVTGPMQGFGRLWQRTYTCPIGPVATPQQAIAEWRAHFGEFWPGKSRFYGALEGINPGDVAPIAVAAGGGLKLTTGVLVLYADDESFSFMTPEGHMFAGMITFSAHEDESGTILQTQVLIRPNDPLYELGMPVMKRMEDRFWSTTMCNLANRLGALGCDVDVTSIIVDRKRLWHNARNVRYNAGIRSVLHLLGAPFTFAARKLRRRAA
ncbi:DUF1990 family protein [uncultured Jatrophihabitans sp.]|uniref:DUF1990 family protein n=1 Tax=uncultured Jatrophihabitans sp. TaxID=1610747 RepID=UPI0035CB5B04